MALHRRTAALGRRRRCRRPRRRAQRRLFRPPRRRPPARRRRWTGCGRPQQLRLPRRHQHRITPGTTLKTVPGQGLLRPRLALRPPRLGPGRTAPARSCPGCPSPTTSTSPPPRDHQERPDHHQRQPGISVRHATGLTVQDSAITGVNTTTGRMLAGVKDMYGDSTGLAVLRNQHLPGRNRRPARIRPRRRQLHPQTPATCPATTSTASPPTAASPPC